MKKLISVSILILSVGLCAEYGQVATESSRLMTVPTPTIYTTVVVPNPVYTGGNMTAPKEVIKQEDDYELFGGFSEEDINLMAAIVYYEAGNQCQEGKSYVVDVILNRLDNKKFPDSIVEILSAPKQFSTYKKASQIKDTDIPIDCYGAVIQEVHERSNTEVLYFSSEGYNGKTPLFKCGDHYFSK